MQRTLLRISTAISVVALLSFPLRAELAKKPAPKCGNGILESGERCDDGNTVKGDGCSAKCTIERGWTCTGKVCTKKPICGDGIVNGSEQCDLGKYWNTEHGGCNANCTIESGWECKTTNGHSACDQLCGNGVLDNGEKCDMGNRNGELGCTTGCEISQGWHCDDSGKNCQPLCLNGSDFFNSPVSFSCRPLTGVPIDKTTALSPIVTYCQYNDTGECTTVMTQPTDPGGRPFTCNSPTLQCVRCSQGQTVRVTPMSKLSAICLKQLQTYNNWPKK